MQAATGRGRPILQRKVATIVVAGLVVSFALFGLLAREAVKQSTEAVFQERLMMAQITAGHIDYELKEAMDFLQSTPRSVGIDLHDSNSAPERSALAQVRGYLPVFAQQVYLVDRNGTVVLTDPPDSPLEGANVFDYVHVRKVLEGSRGEISGVVLDPVTRTPTVALAVPVADQSGRTIGVMGASVDVARASLAGLIVGLKPGQTGHTQIIDGNGTVMASTSPAHVLRRSHHYDLLFTLMRQKAATVIAHATEDGFESKREMVAFAPLSQAAWGVSVEQDEEEALAVGRELETRLIVLGLLSLLGALATCFIVMRQVLVPIASLTEASEQIAAGELTGPALAGGNDEIGRLATSFEVMRARLKQSRDELDRWHKELELRVEQRTAELSCLFELSKTIASSVDLDDMLTSTVRKVVEILGTPDAAYIYLYGSERERMVLRAWHGDLPPGMGILYQAVAAQAYSSRKALLCTGREVPPIVSSLVRDSRHEDGEPSSDWRDLGAITCAPLLAKDRVYGALVLHSVEVAGTTPPGLALVQALADQIAVGIQRSELAREAEQAAALREADRLKSHFISTITHELQTPIGFIKGYATTLLRPQATFDTRTTREFLQIISEESDSLSALIDDLLDVSRIESGALSINREPTSLGRLVRRAVERARARPSSHQFRLKVEPRLPAADVDPRRIEQVLHNLLDNAVKYSPKGGTITVTARSGSSALVSVADEGIGIAPEEIDRVFERFYRASGAPAASRRGAGLGLSICRGIVEAHGGRIWLDSEPGRGTTVYVTLPLATQVGTGVAL